MTDAAVDDDVSDMNALRPKLARHRLRDLAQAALRGGKRGEVGRAANRGGGSGKEDGAFASRYHAARGFAAEKKAGVAGEATYVLEGPGRSVDDRASQVRAGVEYGHLDRTALLHALEEIDHLLFLAQVRPFAPRARRQHHLVTFRETTAERRA